MLQVEAGSQPTVNRRRERQAVRSNRLMRSVAWSLAGSLVETIASWVVLAVVANLGSATMVGQYGLAIALVSPILALTGLQLKSLQVTDATQSIPFGSYLSLRLVTQLVALLATIGFVVFSRNEMSAIVVTLLVFGRLAMAAITELFYGLFQRHNLLDRMGQGQVLNGLALVTSTAAGLWLFDSLAGAMAASLAGSSIALTVHILPHARRLARERSLCGGLAPQWHAIHARTLIRLGASLGAVAFLFAFASSVPRYLLARDVSDAELGIYVALSSCLVAATALSWSISQVAIPRLTNYRADNDRDRFVQLLGLLELGSLAALTLGVAGAWTVGPWIVSRMFGPEYGAHKAALVWLAFAAGAAMLEWFLSNAITVGRKLDIQVVVQIFGLLVVGGGCLVLIPTYGITGACVAMAARNFVTLAATFAVCLSFLSDWKAEHIQAETNARGLGAG